MVSVDNHSGIKIVDLGLDEICAGLSHRDVEVLLVGSEDMRLLNLEHRGKDNTTDVLSFPLECVGDMLPLGSVVINAQMAKEIAYGFKHTLEDEIKLLFIHGLLHLLGFDHEVDNGEHRLKEEELISKFNLPTSLIVRNALV